MLFFSLFSFLFLPFCFSSFFFFFLRFFFFLLFLFFFHLSSIFFLSPPFFFVLHFNVISFPILVFVIQFPDSGFFFLASINQSNSENIFKLLHFLLPFLPPLPAPSLPGSGNHLPLPLPLILTPLSPLNQLTPCFFCPFGLLRVPSGPFGTTTPSIHSFLFPGETLNFIPPFPPWDLSSLLSLPLLLSFFLSLSSFPSTATATAILYTSSLQSYRVYFTWNCIGLSIHLYIYTFKLTNRPTDQPTNQLTNQPTDQLYKQSINQIKSIKSKPQSGVLCLNRLWIHFQHGGVQTKSKRSEAKRGRVNVISSDEDDVRMWCVDWSFRWDEMRWDETRWDGIN